MSDNICEWPTCNSEATNSGMCYMHWKTYGTGSAPAAPKPLPKKSETRKEQEKTYHAIVKEMLSAQPLCQMKMIGCTGKSQGLHHQKKRAGKNYLNKKYLIPACNSCQLRAETHPLEAIQMGASISKFRPEPNRA